MLFAGEFEICIVPPIVHFKVLSIVTNDDPRNLQDEHPELHGDAIEGMHGAGTNIFTPAAAAVADALALITVGFVVDWHDNWKGTMLVNGLLSNIFAIGCLLDIDILVGRTKRDPGAPGGKVPVSGTGRLYK